MQTVNIHDAKTHFSRYVEQVAAGEEIIISRAGKPIARLMPLEQPKPPRQLGLGAGLATIPDDFDRRDADEIQAAFEGDA